MKRKPTAKIDAKAPAPAASRAKARSPRVQDDAADSEVGELGDVAGAERVIARPDGHHWLSLDGRREFGPFDSYEEALADMQADDEESAAEPGETLQEAELEIGIADWIDPDTGEPAEGLSTPRLQDE